jgi:hypothetical protein
MSGFFETVGLTQTSTDVDGHWGLTQTTALDQLKVVNQIAYPTLLNSDSVQTATDLLNQVESDERWGVSGGVPSGVSVQLKNGWLEDTPGWDINSIGHVHGDGQDYTIAVLTSGNDTEQDGIDLVQSLSAATWNMLATHKSSS